MNNKAVGINVNKCSVNYFLFLRNIEFLINAVSLMMKSNTIISGNLSKERKKLKTILQRVFITRYKDIFINFMM